MAEQNPLPLRWSVEQRMAFIERRLHWDGHINRGDLTSHFSISVPQASADLAQYEQLAPGNLEYDKRAKTYVSSPAFSPRLAEPSARQYLAQLQLIADDVLRPEDSWLGIIPPFSTVPRVRRRLEAKTLRRVVNAIRERRALQIRYQSLSTAEPSTRWIAPHALSFDGYRWHTRAWCESRRQFLDFVLARILDVSDSREETINPGDDRAWHTTVRLRLGPNPLLSPAQQQAVELDFGMTGHVIEVEVRLCLVYYFKRQMLLDLDPKHLPPGRVQVVLLNEVDVDNALESVGETK